MPTLCYRFSPAKHSVVLLFENGDLIDYDVSGDTSTLFFNENLFSASENIDAIYGTEQLTNGVPEPATIAILSFGSLAIFAKKK